MKNRTALIALVTAALLGAGSLVALASTTTRTAFRVKAPVLAPVGPSGEGVPVDGIQRVECWHPDSFRS